MTAVEIAYTVIAIVVVVRRHSTGRRRSSRSEGSGQRRKGLFLHSLGGGSTARADEDAARAKEALHASVVANAEGAALNASIELESPAKPCDAKPPRLKWREIWPFLGPPETLVIDEATPLEGETTAAASFDVALEFVVGCWWELTSPSTAAAKGLVVDDDVNSDARPCSWLSLEPSAAVSMIKAQLRFGVFLILWCVVPWW